MYKIVLTKAAQREYTRLYKTNRRLFERVRAVLLSLGKEPTQGKPLKFVLKGKWSYRIGMYRIIYSIQHNILTIFVLDIDHRRDVYR